MSAGRSDDGLTIGSISQGSLETDALSLLLLKSAGAAAPTSRATSTAGGCLHLEVFPVVGDNGQDGLFEDLFYACHLFATTLHVLGAHLLCDGKALLGGDGGEALGLEHINTCLLVTQIRLQAHEDKRRVRAEVENLGVPLKRK